MIDNELLCPAGVSISRRSTLEMRMLSLTRMVVRGVLAVILFALACAALVAISLAAMYCDWRLEALES